MRGIDDLGDLFTLLLIGGAIVLALIFDGSKPTPSPQYSQVPAYSYSYDDHSDNSTNICIGWCLDGSR